TFRRNGGAEGGFMLEEPWNDGVQALPTFLVVVRHRREVQAARTGLYFDEGRRIGRAVNGIELVLDHRVDGGPVSAHLDFDDIIPSQVAEGQGKPRPSCSAPARP